MKTLNIIAWISGGIGALIILLAVISLVFRLTLFGFVHIVNYFTTANSFFLITIALFIYTHNCISKQ